MKETGKIRLLVVDDHFITRAGLCATLNAEPDLEVIAQAANGAEALTRFTATTPDVALLDHHLPDMTGVELTSALRARFPGARVVMLSAYAAEEYVHAALQAGALGYLLKTDARDDLLAAIRSAHQGLPQLTATAARRLAERLTRTPLSPRERDVLRHLALGQSNKEIAAALGLSEATVKQYAGTLFTKLGALDRVQAVLIALRRGLIEAE